MNITFMGSATFALPTLQRLLEDGHKIIGVITQPDKPSGRGQTDQGPPVKRKACELRLEVYQPKSLKDDEAHALIEAMEPELVIVVAYGKILPPWLIEFPSRGCINLHGSLLPKYRGAAPVHWAIANGETVTGVCTMQIDQGLDTGPVLLCEKTDIGPDETAVQLYDRLSVMGGDLMATTVQRVRDGTLQAHPQDDSQASLAPMLKKEHGFIDWTMPALKIHNLVRAFNPWPGTATRFRGVTCKVLKTKLTDSRGGLEPGTIVAFRRSLTVACGDSILLEILSIQPENRKPVSGVDFANGARIQSDEKFVPLMDNN